MDLPNWWKTISSNVSIYLLFAVRYIPKANKSHILLAGTLFGGDFQIPFALWLTSLQAKCGWQWSLIFRTESIRTIQTISINIIHQLNCLRPHGGPQIKGKRRWSFECLSTIEPFVFSATFRPSKHMASSPCTQTTIIVCKTVSSLESFFDLLHTQERAMWSVKTVPAIIIICDIATALLARYNLRKSHRPTLPRLRTIAIVGKMCFQIESYINGFSLE